MTLKTTASYGWCPKISSLVHHSDPDLSGEESLQVTIIVKIRDPSAIIKIFTTLGMVRPAAAARDLFDYPLFKGRELFFVPMNKTKPNNIN